MPLDKILSRFFLKAVTESHGESVVEYREKNHPFCNGIHFDSL